MKAFVLLLGAVLLVAGCEPEGGQKTEAPSTPAESATSAADTPAPVPSRAERLLSESEMGIEGHIWAAKSIGGKDVVENSGVILSLNRGEATGKTGCNSYRGGYTITNPDKIAFTPLLTTRMACSADALMAQERTYLDILFKVVSFERDDGGTLILKTADGQAIRFAAE